ncbi:SDR family NAD(P)-dependent oxidoreductase [Polyangium aurulentum]|uniref:SDR family NAD(P)-dependent oxidoreductase n=1 Tax=Polyangium aurulentum TaxID=2567896 RepID=UPI0010AEA5B8|nr:SDR family oxidoreductase [Polyangium aurulentum]UQA56167.1 SDR family oxidoreductase [Polyangium aurulentum]
MKVKNKVVVVTGGGNGIGRELVLALLSRGARVAAVDIHASALEETLALAGRNREGLATHTVDVTDRAAVDALPAAVISRFGAVDGVINNAGVIQPFVRLKDLDYAAIDRVMNVNLFGTLYMTKAFLPHLLARPEAHIANVSSMGGFLPVPGQTIYGAAKAAVKLLTEGLSSELLGTNVKVTIIFPGAIGTNIAVNSGVMDSLQMKPGDPSPKMLPPAKAARIILEGIERDRYRVLVGPDAMFMDAIYRLDPRRAARFIYKQMSGLLPK